MVSLNKLSIKNFGRMMKEAVDIENEFITLAIPDRHEFYFDDIIH